MVDSLSSEIGLGSPWTEIRKNKYDVQCRMHDTWKPDGYFKSLETIIDIPVMHHSSVTRIPIFVQPVTNKECIFRWLFDCHRDENFLSGQGDEKQSREQLSGVIWPCSEEAGGL